jgi:hypothetical protein
MLQSLMQMTGERKKERKKFKSVFNFFVSRLLQAKPQNTTGFSQKVLRMNFSSML